MPIENNPFYTESPLLSGLKNLEQGFGQGLDLAKKLEMQRKARQKLVQLGLPKEIVGDVTVGDIIQSPQLAAIIDTKLKNEAIKYSPLPSGAGVLNTRTGEITAPSAPKQKLQFKGFTTTGEKVSYDPSTGDLVTESGQKPNGPLLPPTAQAPAGETAGKLIMADEAMNDVREAKKLLFPNGKFDKSLLITANVPGTAGIGTKGREFYSRLQTGAASRLLIQSGVAASENELKRLMGTFYPTILDSEDSAKDKLDRLERFLGRIKGVVDPTGRLTALQVDQLKQEFLNPQKQQSKSTQQRIKFDIQGNILPK